jgi:hypothetical protein
VFKYVSITDGTEMDGYIIQWANDFFYKDCAHRSAAYPRDKDRTKTPNVINNGIKNLSGTRTLGEHYVEMVVERGKNHGDEFEWHTRAVINKGVKEVSNSMNLEPKPEFVEEVVNKGIKEVNQSDSIHRQRRAENEMSRMIKEVKPNRVTVHDEKMDRFYYSTDCAGNNTEIFRIIDEGVKEIKPSIWTTKRGVDIHDLMCSGNTTDISSITKNGIKNIYPDQNSGDDGYNWSNEFEADKVIEYGVKL